MLKAISTITNAIGALNYKGTWNASTNSPALASGVGTKGDYYVVSVAGSTTLDGISNWGVGDLATFNGIVWQRVEGGADGNFVNLSVSSTSTLSGLTASTALALDASKNVVSVTNTGTGNNVLATDPTLVGNVNLSTGNLVIGTSGKGIDFSATSGTGTSELLADYEEGTWTPTVFHNSVNVTSLGTATGKYIKIGKMVYLAGYASKSASPDTDTGTWELRNLPYTVGGTDGYPICTFNGAINSTGTAAGAWGTPSSASTRLILVNSIMNSTAWVSGYFELHASGCFEAL